MIKPGYASDIGGAFSESSERIKNITNVRDEIVEKYFQTNQILYLLSSRRDIHEKKGKEFLIIMKLLGGKIRLFNLISMNSLCSSGPIDVLKSKSTTIYCR